MSRHQWLVGGTQLRTCPHQQCAVECQGFKNHSLIIKQKKDKKPTPRQHQGPLVIKATLNFSHAKDEDDLKQRVLCRKQCWDECRAEFSTGFERSQKKIQVSQTIQEGEKLHTSTVENFEAVSFCQRYLYTPFQIPFVTRLQ